MGQMLRNIQHHSPVPNKTSKENIGTARQHTITTKNQSPNLVSRAPKLATTPAGKESKPGKHE